MINYYRGCILSKRRETLDKVKISPSATYMKVIKEEKKKNQSLFKNEVDVSVENIFFAAKRCNINANNTIIGVDDNGIGQPSIGGLIMVMFNLINMIYRLTPPIVQATLPDKEALLEAATRLFLVKAPNQPIDQLLFSIEEPDYFEKKDFEDEVAKILGDASGKKETVGGRMLLTIAQAAKIMIFLAEDRQNNPAFCQRADIPLKMLEKLSGRRQGFYYVSEFETLRYMAEYMPLDDQGLITKVLIMAVIQSNGVWYDWSKQ